MLSQSTSCQLRAALQTNVFSGHLFQTLTASALLALASIVLAGCGGNSPATGGSKVADSTPSLSAVLSARSFDFGGNLVGNTITQAVATVTNTGTAQIQMSPQIYGDPVFSIASSSSCGKTLAPGASCSLFVSYTPTAPSLPKTQTASLALNWVGLAPGTPQTVALTGISAAMPTGVVTPTANPQVALYSVDLPFPGSISVQFGPTTDYGRATWEQSSDPKTNQAAVLVAGMLPNTQYHMSATITLPNGVSVADKDHVFATGALPSAGQLTLTAEDYPAGTPQPGLEFVNTLRGLAALDLAGNVLWTYSDPHLVGQNMVDGAKLLPNGHFILVMGTSSESQLNFRGSDSSVKEVREIDLAGNIVRSVSLQQLNERLAQATCAECNVSLLTFHHDITVLPNGHWLVLANTIQNLSPATQPQLTNAPAQAVLGDVLVDLDDQLQPVWAWNAFNHLDPNRHPMNFPDWTHANAIVYAPDDGNLLVSMRHQNWVLKLDYHDGAGSGRILWRLGEAGDFTLVGGTSPTDWAYAQHFPSFFGSATSGVFDLGMMDNGNDRVFPNGVACGTAGNPPCTYSSAPVYRIDESAMTASLVFHQIAPASQYSFWGGSANLLNNGNVEYDLCGTSAGSYVYEVTFGPNPQPVWSLTLSGSNFYRAFRIPSLYPGVQW